MEIQTDNKSLGVLLEQLAAKAPSCPPGAALHWQGDALVVMQDGAPLRRFPVPVRAGAVLDFLTRRQDRPLADTLPETLPLGPYVFHPRPAKLTRAGRDDIILTDKERDLLAVLYQAPGRALDRQTLLDLVWAYADGVETHTLETHIYRLRRKIEDNLAEPQWLVSRDGEYKLNI